VQTRHSPHCATQTCLFALWLWKFRGLLVRAHTGGLSARRQLPPARAPLTETRGGAARFSQGVTPAWAFGDGGGRSAAPRGSLSSWGLHARRGGAGDRRVPATRPARPALRSVSNTCALLQLQHATGQKATKTRSEIQKSELKRVPLRAAEELGCLGRSAELREVSVCPWALLGSAGRVGARAQLWERR